MSSNPLVAGPVGTATATSGTVLVDDITTLAQAIEGGNWVEAGLAGFGTVMDGLSAAIDPLGALIAMGVGWVLDHIDPLKSWLNDLTGDAGAVHGFSATWANISQEFTTQSGAYRADVAADLAGMDGAGVAAYRSRAGQLADFTEGAARAAAGISGGLTLASTLVQFVHDLVRDTIAELVGSLGSALAWAATGVGIPYAITIVSEKAAALSARIASKVTGLVRSIAKLDGLLRQLDPAIRQLDETVAALRHGPGGSAALPGPRPGGDGRVHYDLDPPGTYRDANGRLHDADGSFTSDPYSGGPKRPDHEAVPGETEVFPVDRDADGDLADAYRARDDAVTTAAESAAQRQAALEALGLDPTARNDVLREQLDDLADEHPELSRQIVTAQSAIDQAIVDRSALAAASEQVGEAATRQVIEARGDTVIVGLDGNPAGANRIDGASIGSRDGQVTLTVWEAKGGSGSLDPQGRLLPDGTRAAQGSAEYLQDLLGARIDPRLSAWLQAHPDVADALARGEVRIEYKAVSATGGGQVRVTDLVLGQQPIVNVPNQSR